VFLIGTHAAFFGPAKYGAMPEILRPHILSRGNGILESTTFLAKHLRHVSGGVLMYTFHKKRTVDRRSSSSACPSSASLPLT